MFEHLPRGLLGDREVDMEDEEAEDGQSDDSRNYDHDDDDCCLADFPGGLLDDEDDHVDDEEADGQEDEGQEEHEVAVVPFGDASPHETAVVVEDLDAVVARRAVTRSLRPEDLTSSTKTSRRGHGLASFCRCRRDVQEMSVTFPSEFEEGSFGNDSGIGAGGEVEEEVHECYADEEDEGKGGIDLPVDAHHEDAEGHRDAH